MNPQLPTWHYGLVARYWAEHNTEGPEIAYFQNLIERYGQPALDAGCGTGRLLIPFLRAGLDIDGCDVSPDMLAYCRERAEREGLQPRLYQQPLHELDLPRTYQSIVACGVVGLGGSRQQDLIALRRFHQHLIPGGVLLLDNYLPHQDQKTWQLWQKEPRQQLPQSWPQDLGKAPPEDGSDYQLYHRVIAFDPLEQQITRQMRTVLWREGQIVADEVYLLTENLYFRNEIILMLESVGFRVESIQGDYTEHEATAEHQVITFIARKNS